PVRIDVLRADRLPRHPRLRRRAHADVAVQPLAEGEPATGEVPDRRAGRPLLALRRHHLDPDLHPRLPDPDMTETTHVEHEASHGEAPGVTAHGHPSDGQYVIVALVLGAVTGIEVAVYYISAIPKHLLTTMLIVMSGVKFTAVVLWFMHLKFDNRMFRRLFVTGLVLALAVFLVFLSSLHFYAPSRR